MKKYILKRTLALIPTFLGIMMTLGLLFTAMPGNFADGTTDAVIRTMAIHKYHLDQPKTVQFICWFKNFIKGDMGIVYTFSNKPDSISVTPFVISAAKHTFIQMFISVGISILIAIPLGTISAARNGTKKERTIKFFSILGISIPGFAAALIIIYALKYNRFMISYGLKRGYVFWMSYSDFLSNKLIPPLVLTPIVASKLTRYVYMCMSEVIHSDFSAVARCYGFTEKKILYKYSLKNALVPLMSIMGTSFPALFSEVMIIEAAVGADGLGNLFVDSVFKRQYFIMMSILTVIVLIVLVFNYLLDILYGLMDPRIRTTT